MPDIEIDDVLVDPAIEHTWNHRVMRHKVRGGEDYFAIHEVHYDNGIVRNWTTDPVDVGGDSIESLRWTLERMLKALDQPVMEYGPNE